MIAFLIGCMSLSIVSAQNYTTIAMTTQDVTGAENAGTWTTPSTTSSSTSAVTNSTITGNNTKSDASAHVQQPSIIISISIIGSLFTSFFFGHT